MSAEHLYELVNQTLLANFGPLGSYAITRRESSDSDDIFHTMLASSVAHNIVGNLINHSAIALEPSKPVGGSFVSATSTFAATRALPSAPLGAEGLPPLRVGSHAAERAVVAPLGAAAPASAVAPAVAAVAAAPVAATAPAVAAPALAAPALAATTSLVGLESAEVVTPMSVSRASTPILPLPVSAVSVPLAPSSAVPVSSVSVSLAPLVAVPVSAELAAALTELDQTGPIHTATSVTSAAAGLLREHHDARLVGSDQ